MSSGLGGGHPKFPGPLSPVWPTTFPTRHSPGHITHLPAKTLGEIFLYTCDTYTLESQAPDLWVGRAKDVMMAPIVLSQVCRRWRNIANTTPRLWRNVVVRLTRRISAYASEMIEEYILKSDPFTINLCFLAAPDPPPLEKYTPRNQQSSSTECSPKSLRDNTGYALEDHRVFRWPLFAYSGDPSEIIDIIIKSTRRWERVLFSGSVVDHEELFCRNRPALYLPKLSYLQVPKGPGLRLEGSPLFEHVYALRTLNITGSTFAQYTLPWICLRKLHATDMQDTEILEILVRCPCLEELTIQGPRSDSKPSPRRTGHILMPQLQSLSLMAGAGKPSEAPLYLLSNLVTPSILEVKLSNLTSKTPLFTRPLQVLRQLLQRSCAGENLRSVSLTSIPILEQDLISLLELTKRLVSLNIDVEPTMMGADTCSINGLPVHLSSTGGSPPFLPRLKIFVCFGIQFAMEDLVALLYARSRLKLEAGGDPSSVVQPLQDVHIHVPYSSELSPGSRTTLDLLRESGMKLRLNNAEVGDCGCPGR